MQEALMRGKDNVQVVGGGYLEKENNVDRSNIVASTVLQGSGISYNDTTLILELVGIIKDLLKERDKYIRQLDKYCSNRV